MAVTYNDYAGDGSTTLFPFTFEYLERDEVKVLINGTPLTSTQYSFATATSIQLASSVTIPQTGDVIRVYRDTDVDTLKATFFPGSAIKAEDLNNNFTQSNFVAQEVKNTTWDVDIETIKSTGTWTSSDDRIATTAAIDARFQDEVDETITSTETWVSDDDHIATTAALDARFQDELSETIESTETWVADDDHIATTQAIEDRIDEVITNDIGTDGTGITVTDDGDGTITLGLGAGSIDLDRIKDADIVTSSETNPNNDTTIATTAKIDDMIDEAITGDVLIDTTGLTKVTSGGQTTLGIGAGSVDLDRIKDDDIITYAEQEGSTAVPTDTNIFTASAAARRFDTLVTTSSPTGTAWETGKTWLQNDGDRTLSIWDGSEWIGVASGGVFNNQPKVVYVDPQSGNDTSDGHRVSTPKAKIKAAIEQINAEINTSITNPGSGYTDGIYTSVALTGGGSTGLTADIEVGNGVVTTVTVNNTTTLEDYGIGDVLSAADADLGGGGGSGLEITVGGDGDGQVVILSPGVYQEVAPIQIKRRNVSIIGQSLRSCIVHPTPATQTNTLFEVNSGTFIQNMTFTGVKAGTGTGNTLDPLLPVQQGWNVAFYSGARILKSPYIQSCTNFSDSEIDNNDLKAHNPRGGQAGDLDSLPTGGGLLVNGATVSSDSPLRSIVCDSYTHVGLNGPGILVVNNGYVQATSSYAFFNKYHIKCRTGGQANLAASTTDFGEKGLIADGRSTNAIFTSTTFADAADQDTEFFINGPTARTATPLPWHGSSTRPQSNMVVDIGGNTYPILSSSNTFASTEIVSGRDYTILIVGDTDFTAIGAASNTVGVQFTATGVGTGSGTVTDDTGWRVTISRPDSNDRSNNLGLDGAVLSGGNVDFFLRSQIASSGHTMEYVGSGMNYTALPENGGVPVPGNETEEIGDGKIWAVTVNDKGTLKAGGTFEINQQTGEVTIPSGGAQLADYVKQTNTVGEAKLPSGSTGERTASPLAGHVRFNTSTAQFEGYDGSSWSNFAQSAATTAPAFLETPATLTASKIIPANTNAALVGDVTLDANVTITINNGSKLTVLS